MIIGPEFNIGLRKPRFSLFIHDGMNGGKSLNTSVDNLIGPMRRRNLRGYDPDTMPGLVPSCDIIRDGDASFFVSDIGLGDSANSDWFGNNI